MCNSTGDVNILESGILLVALVHVRVRLLQIPRERVGIEERRRETIVLQSLCDAGRRLENINRAGSTPRPRTAARKLPIAVSLSSISQSTLPATRRRIRIQQSKVSGVILYTLLKEQIRTPATAARSQRVTTAGPQLARCGHLT